MAALLVRDAARVRRDRHHQHVRRHPVRSRVRDRRQPGARGFAQCRRRSCGGAGAARLGARHRRAGHRQPGFADRLGGDAARLARRAARATTVERAAAARSRRRSTAPSPGPQWRTRDLGGPLGTKAFGERVAELVGNARLCEANCERRSSQHPPGFIDQVHVVDARRQLHRAFARAGIRADTAAHLDAVHP